MAPQALPRWAASAFKPRLLRGIGSFLLSGEWRRIAAFVRTLQGIETNGNCLSLVALNRNRSHDSRPCGCTLHYSCGNLWIVQRASPNQMSGEMLHDVLQ